MKKIQTSVLALTALLMLTLTTAFAQKAPTKATSNFIRIDKKGGIHDHGGTLLGQIGKDDIVRDNQGKTIYFIDKNGNVINAKGNKLGMAKKNGFYFNNVGETILTVKDKDAEECEILDPQGHNFGTTHKNYKLHACAAHCLFLKEKSTPHPVH
ncbi:MULTISPECIES: 5-fold beta-flower protein [unclassified Mucilaginibacter]|uniref:5-fold beta-flower protein n=1 Tax=unclassified Mucilaginibacter TaxID=2617802 RepID=UPI00339A577D